MAREERGEVRHAPVVDAPVGLREAPRLQVGPEVLPHVLVDEALEVDPGVPKGADEGVGADGPVGRHVAPGVGEPPVAAVVEDGDADLSLGPFEDAGGAALRRLRRERRGEEEPSATRQRARDDRRSPDGPGPAGRLTGPSGRPGSPCRRRCATVPAPRAARST